MLGRCLSRILILTRILDVVKGFYAATSRTVLAKLGHLLIGFILPLEKHVLLQDLHVLLRSWRLNFSLNPLQQSSCISLRWQLSCTCLVWESSLRSLRHVSHILIMLLLIGILIISCSYQSMPYVVRMVILAQRIKAAI